MPPPFTSPPWRRFAITLAALGLVFAWPLVDLVRFAAGSSLFSHVVLIPFVSAYLVWQQRRSLPAPARPARGPALVALAAGLLCLGWFGLAMLEGDGWDRQDRLASTIAALVAFVAAAGLWTLGRATMRALAFPFAFLVFMIPLPGAVVAQLEYFLQHGSAAAARLFFAVSGMPLFYDNLTFQLPGFAMQVAPECSGIHSSLVLFITSTLAAHLFLYSRWRQAGLVAFVLPLALLRNGLRVFVIGQLCVRVGPEMIRSWIHRQGGPVFFVLSLVPFLLLLYCLVHSERRASRAAHPSTPA